MPEDRAGWGCSSPSRARQKQSGLRNMRSALWPVSNSPLGWRLQVQWNSLMLPICATISIRRVSPVVQFGPLAGIPAIGYRRWHGRSPPFNGPVGLAGRPGQSLRQRFKQTIPFAKITPAGMVVTWAGVPLTMATGRRQADGKFSKPAELALTRHGTCSSRIPSTIIIRKNLGRWKSRDGHRPGPFPGYSGA